MFKRELLPALVLLALGCAQEFPYIPNDPVSGPPIFPSTIVGEFVDETRIFDMREYGEGAFLASMIRHSDSRIPHLSTKRLAQLLVLDLTASGAFAAIRLSKISDVRMGESLLIQGAVKEAVYHHRGEGARDSLTITLLMRAMQMPEGRIVWEKTYTRKVEGHWPKRPDTQAAALLRTIFQEARKGLTRSWPPAAR